MSDRASARPPWRERRGTRRASGFAGKVPFVNEPLHERLLHLFDEERYLDIVKATDALGPLPFGSEELDVTVRLVRATALEKCMRFREAIAVIHGVPDDLLARTEQRQHAMMLLGVSWMQLGAPRESERCLRAILGTGDDEEARLALAFLYRAAQPLEALRILSEPFFCDTVRAIACRETALLHLMIRRGRGGLALLRRDESTPREPMAQLYAAYIALCLGQEIDHRPLLDVCGDHPVYTAFGGFIYTWRGAGCPPFLTTDVADWLASKGRRAHPWAAFELSRFLLDVGHPGGVREVLRSSLPHLRGHPYQEWFTRVVT